MKPEEKRKQILRGLEEVCRDKRFHEVKLDEVAQIAGVGKGTIYRYFASKEELFQQLVAYGLERLCEQLQCYIEDRAPFRERLVGMCQTISAFFQTRHALVRMAGEQENCSGSQGASHREAVLERRRRLDAMVAQVLRAGCECGALRTDIALEVAARLLMSMMRERNTTFAESPVQPTVETIIDLFLSGFGRVDGGGGRAADPTERRAGKKPGARSEGFSKKKAAVKKVRLSRSSGA